MLNALVRLVAVVVLGGAVALLGALGVRLARADVEASLYRDRLRDVAGEYERLRSDYNEAVRRTAVTELLVTGGGRGGGGRAADEEGGGVSAGVGGGGSVSVRVRTAAGVERVVETPFDPSGEIYVDFVVLGGRVWIRRVFDAETPPSRGVLIDPELAGIDWEGDAGARFGKAVYRSLSPGRWVVSVTGDGSLGLARAEAGEGPTDLVAAPAVRSFEEDEREVDARVDSVTWWDALRRLLGLSRSSAG